MKKLLFSVVTVLLTSVTLHAQVGIGTETPEGALDVVSTNSGVIVPRVATAADVTTPVNGMIIYDLSLNCFNFYEDGDWSGCKDVIPPPTIADIVDASTNPAAFGTPSIEDLQAVGVTGDLLSSLQTAYEEAIATASPAPTTLTQLQAIIDAVNAAQPVFCTPNPTEVVPRVGAAGKTWMDRNLGATRAATSHQDADAYGDYYQWGRFADGHQCSASGLTATPAASYTPGHDDFIITSSSPDWLSTPDNSLWDGLNGTNNPCPSGYRLPTTTEFTDEIAAWDTQDAAGAYDGLRLTLSGFRSRANGVFSSRNSLAFYWASPPNSDTNGGGIVITSTNASANGTLKANGVSVRCIKEIGLTSSDILLQIGNEADTGDTVNSIVTVNELNIITPQVTGVDRENEAAYQDYIDGYPDKFTFPATQAEVQEMVNNVNITEAVPAVGSASGAIWMDRNLGATQVATSPTDVDSYGDLYQWGRGKDGHQIRTSSTNPTPATSSTPAHGDFITTTGGNWLATPDATLWQGVEGTNNPCPIGFRLPTKSEFDTELSMEGITNDTDAFNSALKLPSGSYRNKDGSIAVLFSPGGAYWTSTLNSSNAANYLLFYSGDAEVSTSTGNLATGNSVRCIKHVP